MELHIATYMIEVSPVMSVTPRINQALIFFHRGGQIFHGNHLFLGVASPSARLALGYFTCSSSRLGNTRGIPQLANTETSEYSGTEYIWIYDGGSEPYSSMPNMPRDFRTYRKILGACNDKCWTTRRLSWHPVKNESWADDLVISCGWVPVEGMRPTKPRWPKVPTSQPFDIFLCLSMSKKWLRREPLQEHFPFY